jgi:F-type H+-transporting ATPase subunit epsilon
MADKITFDLVSPERLLLSESAEMVTVPGREGDFGVLAGHAPVISSLRPGVIDVKGGSQGEARFFVLGGFAEVNAQKLTVLAEDVVPMGEIDAAALDRRIADAGEDILQAKTEADRAKAVESLDHLKLLRAALQIPKDSRG